MVFARVPALLPQLASGAFIGLHGSWNRKELSGYKVVFVPFDKGQPQGMPVDVLTGFVSDNGKALGRPVGVALDRRGAPRQRTSPATGRVSPAIARSSVDLPLPLGPTSIIQCDGGRRRSSAANSVR